MFDIKQIDVERKAGIQRAISPPKNKKERHLRQRDEKSQACAYGGQQQHLALDEWGKLIVRFASL